MCGRFVQKQKDKFGHIIGVRYSYRSIEDWPDRYNVSPGQQALVLRMYAPNQVEITPMLWGLIPHWAKEKGKFSTINARVETIDEKPAYRYSFRHHRCIIPIDGYYEWAQSSKGKQPYYFHRPDNEPLALAGLWDTWKNPKDPEGKEIESFTIIVRPAVQMINEIHDRMPSILPEEKWDEWLNPRSMDWIGMKEQLMFGDPGPLDWYAVSKKVNSSKTEGEELVRPV